MTPVRLLTLVEFCEALDGLTAQIVSDGGDPGANPAITAKLREAQVLIAQQAEAIEILKALVVCDRIMDPDVVKAFMQDVNALKSRVVAFDGIEIPTDAVVPADDDRAVS